MTNITTNITTLSDQELQDKIAKLLQESRRIETEILSHLREVERRMLYAKRGYTSLYEYCVRDLHLSEGAAYRRISAMRLLREVPSCTEQLRSGALNMTTATLAQQYFCKHRELEPEKKVEILHSLMHKTKKEVETELRKIDGLAPLDISLIRVALTQELRAKIELAKQSLRLPENTSIEELLEILVERTLAQARKQPQHSKESSSSLSRYIPANIKVAVWQRDQARCTYSDPLTKKRCEAKYALQFDHIVPFSAGGKSVIDNLRLLCPAHNQLHAVQSLGRETMEKFLTKLR